MFDHVFNVSGYSVPKLSKICTFTRLSPVAKSEHEIE